MKIYYREHKSLEEDEIAQIEHIFNSFNQGKSGAKIRIEYLPKILRLLHYNISKTELQDLILFIDKNALGYFTMKELVLLLEEFKFLFD